MEEILERMNAVLYDKQRCDEEYERSLVSSEQFRFVTPPSTPGGSLMGSRAGSVRSLNSFNSRPSSVASDSTECEGAVSGNRSRNNSVSSYQSSHQSNSHNKRSSTLSTKSRDSGFSSQEILLLRQQEALKQNLNSPRHNSISSRTRDPSPIPGQHPAVITRRPPIPPKYRPLVPERKSSLDRCGPNFPNCADNNNYPRRSFNEKTPTNGNIIFDQQQQSAALDNIEYSSFSSHSTNSSGYGSVNIGDPESPDADGDKTLRRHPRKTSEPEPGPGPAPDSSGSGSHAEYIRCLTERLSQSYDF